MPDRATKRMAYVKELLATIGIDPGRVEMYYNSSAMGPQFAQCCRDFTERICQLGAGLRRDRAALVKMAAAPAVGSSGPG